MKQETNEWKMILIALAFLLAPIAVGYIATNVDTSGGNARQTSEK